MKKSNLRATAAWQALALLGAGSVLLTAAPAAAQTTEPGAQVDPNAVPTTADEAADEAGQTQNPPPGEPVAGVTTDTEADDAIVVTGTILRATAKATPSPVQVVDFDEAEKRGINTVNDAIQNQPADLYTTSRRRHGSEGAAVGALSDPPCGHLIARYNLVLDR